MLFVLLLRNFHNGLSKQEYAQELNAEYISCSPMVAPFGLAVGVTVPCGGKILESLHTPATQRSQPATADNTPPAIHWWLHNPA